MHIALWKFPIFRNDLCLPIVEICIVTSKLSLWNVGSPLDANEERGEEYNNKKDNGAKCSYLHIFIGWVIPFAVVATAFLIPAFFELLLLRQSGRCERS